MDVGCSYWLGPVFYLFILLENKLPIFQRFTLVAFFGAVSLFPFYIIEEFMFQRTSFSQNFFHG